MHAISSYRGNTPSNKHINTQTGPIKVIFQLRFQYDSRVIRAQFDYEAYEMPTIRVRYNILRGAYEQLCAFEQ